VKTTDYNKEIVKLHAKSNAQIIVNNQNKLQKAKLQITKLQIAFIWK